MRLGERGSGLRCAWARGLRGRRAGAGGVGGACDGEDGVMAFVELGGCVRRADSAFEGCAKGEAWDESCVFVGAWGWSSG